MSRAWITYATMIALLALGIAAVLAAGSRLRAPQDLRGRYAAAWETTPPTGVRDGADLRIEQSGRYLALSFDGGPRWSLELVGGRALGEAGSTALARLEGTGAAARIDGAGAPERIAFALDGGAEIAARLARAER